MVPSTSQTRLLLSFLLVAAGAATAKAEAQERSEPDPAAVRRYGPAWRYPQDGWIVLHVEGKPYERGYQHGYLLVEEVIAYAQTNAEHRSAKSPADGWAALRLLTDALFLRGFDAEYLEEMRGIADGCNAAGARLWGKPLDLLDIATVNAAVELLFVDEGLAALPTGLEGKRFAAPDYKRPGRRGEGHCSAFAATGPATRDGKVVFGHITMFRLEYAQHYRVWLDIVPSSGHRVVMQAAAGTIWSGLDWYQNDRGLLLAETTIGQTAFERNGRPLASRARKAIQHGDSIDDLVAILTKDNNGLYSNEWLMADTRSGEIALFELGTKRSRLLRSSRDEWFCGTKGFYFGCNNERDLEVRLEQHASLEAAPQDLTWHPSDRDLAWQELWKQHQGKIDLTFGKLAFTTPPLAAAHSLDAKVTSTALAEQLACVARYGPPLGRTWLPTRAQRERGVPPLAGNDWTLLGAAPIAAADSTAIDLGLGGARLGPALVLAADAAPAWRGTCLPAPAPDLWLAPAIAGHERLVATELSAAADQRDEARALLRFRERARWQHAARRLGVTDVPLARLSGAATDGAWHDLARGKGTMLLEGLREALGDEPYVAAMDALGMAHAGKRLAAADLAAALGKAGLRDAAARIEAFAERTADPGPAAWSIAAFELEPGQALIVHASAKEPVLHRECAELLQREIAARWANHAIPIRDERSVTDAELAKHHLVVVGRPGASALLARLLAESKAFPVEFGSASLRVGERLCAHPGTAVVAAGPNPRSARHALVVYAGLSAESTLRSVGLEPQECEVLLAPHAGEPRALAVDRH